MPSNTVNMDFGPDSTVIKTPTKSKYEPTKAKEYFGLKILQNSMSLLAHVLIGITFGVTILFSFRDGLPLKSTNLHALVCGIGYQLLMAESILSLNPEGGFSSKLSLVHRRRLHWILQILGSGLAIAGSFIKILKQNTHFTSLHGQFALVAMVFTSVSLVNGVTSLYSHELRKYLPGKLSKLSHIIFGVVAFATASISLIYGYEKRRFKNWATVPLKDTLIGVVAILTFIIIINPLITFYTKTKAFIKN